jgi:hypothetical protein
MKMSMLVFNLVMLLCPVNYNIVVSGVVSHNNMVPSGFVFLISTLSGNGFDFIYFGSIVFGNLVIAFVSSSSKRRNNPSSFVKP